MDPTLNDTCEQMDALFDMNDDDLSMFLEQEPQDAVVKPTPVSSPKVFSNPHPSPKPILGKREREELEEGEIEEEENVCAGFYFDITVMRKVAGCVDCHMGRVCKRKM